MQVVATLGSSMRFLPSVTVTLQGHLVPVFS